MTQQGQNNASSEALQVEEIRVAHRGSNIHFPHISCIIFMLTVSSKALVIPALCDEAHHKLHTAWVVSCDDSCDEQSQGRPLIVLVHVISKLLAEEVPLCHKVLASQLFTCLCKTNS